MKTLKLSLLAVTACLLLITPFSCQETEIKKEESGVKSEGPTTTDPNARVAFACPNVYALVLSGGTGSPVPAGLRSYIYKVDLCSAPVGYSFVSAIKIGGTQVTDVTGICDMPGVVDAAWAVTGINSNFPQRLLRVQISTGVAGIVSATTVPLQDIENFGTTGLFVAIKEGTSQLMKVTVPGGACVPFAPVGPTPQYNGLTVVGNKFHAISGLTNMICSPTYGDIFEYNMGGGPYVAKYSYKNLAVNTPWTMKELGFHFDNCCGKRWVVGSSSNIISNNTNITPCVLPNPTFLLNTSMTGQNFWAIYDFMSK